MPSEAVAQTTGFAVDRYDPTPSDLYFASEFPWYSGQSAWALRGGVIMDYAHNPLVARAPNGQLTSVVSDMLLVHGQIGLSFANRIGLNLSVPIGLLQQGTDVTDPNGTLGASGSLGVGDIRAGVRVRIAGESDKSPISLHASVYGYIPLSSRTSNLSDGAFRVRGMLVLAGHPGPIRWSLGAGVHYRPSYDTGGFSQIGTEGIATAAVGLALAHDKLTIGPEAWVAGNLGNPSSGLSWDGEAMLGAHYLIADTFLVGAGVAMGLTQAPGTPDVRGLLQLTYAPEEHAVTVVDTDGDGVLDPDDLCPEVPQGEHPDPERRGCPLEDRDRDGVYDHDDLCPDTPQGDHPDPERRGCPEGDRDHDGVVDSQDQCPDTPQGDHPDPHRAGCPDGDNDHDGVLNSVDLCPDEPAGLHPDPARPGCPAPDRDHDTVPDAVDHCPDQPGAPSTDPMRNGCPGLVRVEQGMIHILEQVFFATDRDVILPRSNRVLTAVADVLRATPAIHRLAVEGHTDNVGTEAHNMDLSRRRANAVMNWLVAHGVEATRLEAHGYGPTRPIESNATAAGRAHNRRSDFRIIDPPQPGTGSAVNNDLLP